MSSRNIFLIAIVLILSFTAGLKVFGPKTVTDEERLKGYIAPAFVQALADQTLMTPEARTIFYVEHPTIANRVLINGACPFGEQSVLGCYGPRGIFLLDVSGSKLQRVTETAAAHEMLHAAYQRLSEKQKKKFKAIAEAFPITDESLRAKLEIYKKAGEVDLLNELHSLLGTEVEQLSPELENHYARYFYDRKKIVAYSKQSSLAIAQRKQQVDELDLQLQASKSVLDRLVLEIETLNAALTEARLRLSALNPQQDLDFYNQSVRDYNDQVGLLNVKIETHRNLSAKFNERVNERNAIVVDTRAMLEGIDSRPRALREAQ